MSLRRLVALVIGLAVALAGFYQWSSLWQYDTAARGNIISLVWLDSGSSLLGLSFSESSALVRVRYVVSGGKAFTFSFNITQSGAAGRPDIAPNTTIPLRYDSFNPQNAIADLDYAKIRSRSILVLLAGLALLAVGLSAPLLWKRKRKRQMLEK